MSYVDNNLMSGETVVYRTQISSIVYFGPSVLTLFGILFCFTPAVPVGIGFLVIGAARLVLVGIQASSSEFAVTNRRVIIKVGIFSRKTLEMNLTKVENLGVDQGILARLMNCGTILVTGTGGTREKFANIDDPLSFRRKVQEQVELCQSKSTAA